MNTGLRIDDVYLYKADIPLYDCRFYDNEVKAVSYVPLEELRTMVEIQAEVLLSAKMTIFGSWLCFFALQR